MNYMKQPLVDMFELLSREEEKLLAQVSLESDENERLKIIRDLNNVQVILLDITSQLTSNVEAVKVQQTSFYAHCNLSSLAEC